MKFVSTHQILIAACVLLMAPHAATATEANANYVLGPGDVLSLTDNDGMVSIVPILPDGTAVINNSGTIEAAGLTIDAVNRLVNESGKKWLASPHLKVGLARRRLEQVYLLGAVAHPGLYQAKEQSAESPNPSSKSREPFTLSTVLEIAGGLKDTADLRHVHVTRLHPKMVIDVDLWKLLKDGHKEEDLVLHPGDVIFVPTAGTESGITERASQTAPVGKKIRVMGAVVKPGLLNIKEEGTNLLTVIARSGGFSEPNAPHSITVASIADDGHLVTERVSLNRKQRPWARPIKSGDIVIVKTRAIKDGSPHTFAGEVYLGQYSAGSRKHAALSQAQIEERSKHYTTDIDSLWQTAQHLHHGATTKKQIETTYTEFESSLQVAADELDTGEPPKSDWAVELITNYTKPHHKWPAVSPTLDKVLQAREKLVQFTSEQAVANIEQKLYRLATPEDKSRYYSSPDLRPSIRKQR